MANNPYKYEDPSGHKLKDFLQVGKNFVKPSIPQYVLDLANTARNTILNQQIEKVKNTKVTNPIEAVRKAGKLAKLSLQKATPGFIPQPCPKKSWWETGCDFVKGVADGIGDLTTGVAKRVGGFFEETYDHIVGGIISSGQFVYNLVTDFDGTISGIWNTLTSEKIFTQGTFGICIGAITFVLASPFSVPVAGISLGAAYLGFVGGGELYDYEITHDHNFQSFIESRGASSSEEYQGRLFAKFGFAALEGYITGKYFDNKFDSTKVPDNDIPKNKTPKLSIRERVRNKYAHLIKDPLDEEILIRYESKPSQSLTIDDVVSKAVENTTSTNKNSGFKNFEAKGNYDTAITDFKSLIVDNTLEVKNTQYGKGLMGYTKDGVKVFVRGGSNSGGATLQIFVTKRGWKVRYK